MRARLAYILLMALLVLSLMACGEDPGPQQSDEDYCNTTYVSTWDGRQVKPLSCPE